MQEGNLYFIKDEFYNKYKRYGLLDNKESGRRPCFYLFKDDEDDLYWMIPVSSKIEKYEREYQRSIEKYGVCDNIPFGYINGNKNAFLPQNMFPVPLEYISNVYCNKDTKKPITLKKDLICELNKKARKKIRYNKAGKKLGLTDIVKLREELLQKE